VAAPPPAAPASPPGQGPLRATNRVLEASYVVVPGDTLGSIAAKFGTNVEALQSINNLADRNLLSVGQQLVIPNQP
jgi:LysM repeat protein